MNVTEHALERMAERGFTADMLGRFMNSKYSIMAAKDGRYKLVGKVDGEYWTLVVESDMYTLVTVRKAHGGEV